MFAHSRRVYSPLARDSFDAVEHGSEQSARTDSAEEGDPLSRRSSKEFPLSLIRETCDIKRSRWRYRRRFLLRSVVLCALIAVLLVVITPVLNPSYTRRPSHYTGTNINSEKVFIAANIVDETLIRGAWGTAVQNLVKLLGKENVYLSIYENDSGPGTKAALRELEQKIQCNSSIISAHLDLSELPTIQLPASNETRHRRITYLAEVRNRALRPLDSVPSNVSDVDTGSGAANATHAHAEARFDKLLFLNDVVFSPADAADLLFATNVGDDGRTRYNSACAMDFGNPFKFYDTFATRDVEGYGMGVPFFPWFSTAGEGQSRRGILDGLDAVRVKSCWGGMVAFEARWFQASQVTNDESAPGTPPLRFRAEEELFWESSECCLLQADLQDRAANSSSGLALDGSGIFVNPYIRVAYDETTFRWLGFSRRFERLFTPFHRLADWIAKMPHSSPRRAEVVGQEVVHDEWTEDAREGSGGRLGSVRRVAGAGGFCGGRQLLVLKPYRKAGERMWEKVSMPLG